MGEDHLKTYIGILGIFALGLAASWTYWYGVDFHLRFVLGAAVFAVLILLGDALAVPINERFTVGAWDIGLVVAVALLGPTWAALAAVPSAFYVGRKDWLRTVYELGHNTTIIYLAGIVFSFASGPLIGSDGSSPAVVLYGTVVAGLTLWAGNEAITSVLVKVKYGQTFYETWRESWQPYLLSNVVNIVTAALGVLALVVYGPAAAIVVIAGSLCSQVIVYRSRERFRENGVLRARISSLEKALTASNLMFATMMIEELGRRDGYMHRHAAATAVYAADIAREMRLDEARVERLQTAGLLHNIGMFGLPEEILTAKGKLNSIARNTISAHPDRGARALAAVEEFEEMAQWVRWHHERPDGRGYPDKLRGPWIPLEAKVLSVAQAYAAMVLDQPRRPGMGLAKAREELTAGIDTQFDGTVTRAFLRILDTESEGYRMADDYRFAFPSPGKEKHPKPAVQDGGGTGRVPG